MTIVGGGLTAGPRSPLESPFACVPERVLLAMVIAAVFSAPKLPV